MNTMNFHGCSGEAEFLTEESRGRRFFPVIAGQLTHTRLAGMTVSTSYHCPEFVQTIRMGECGCSSQALTAMNDYLLQAFGVRREVLFLGDNMVVMHPTTLAYLRMQAAIESLKEHAYVPAYPR